MKSGCSSESNIFCFKLYTYFEFLYDLEYLYHTFCINLMILEITEKNIK